MRAGLRLERPAGSRAEFGACISYAWRVSNDGQGNESKGLSLMSNLKTIPASLETAIAGAINVIRNTHGGDSLTLEALTQEFMRLAEVAGYETRPAFKSCALGFIDLSGVDKVAKLKARSSADLGEDRRTADHCDGKVAG